MADNKTIKPNGKLVGSLIWLFLILIAIETFFIFRFYKNFGIDYIGTAAESSSVVTGTEISINAGYVLEYLKSVRNICSRYSKQYNDYDKKAAQGINDNNLDFFVENMNKLIDSQESFYNDLSDLIPPVGLEVLHTDNLTRLRLFIEYLPFAIQWRLTNGENNDEKVEKYDAYLNAKDRLYYEYLKIIDKYNLNDTYEDIFYLEKPKD